MDVILVVSVRPRAQNSGKANAAAAVVGIVVFDRAKRRPHGGCGWRQVLTHERHDRLRRLATQRGGRLDRDDGAIRQDDPFERNDIGPAAASGASKLAERLEDGAIGREAYLAGGWGLVVRRLRSGAVAKGNDYDSVADDGSDYRDRRINSHVGRNSQNCRETSARRNLRRF